MWKPGITDKFLCVPYINLNLKKVPLHQQYQNYILGPVVSLRGVQRIKENSEHVSLYSPPLPSTLTLLEKHTPLLNKINHGTRF